VQVTPPGKAADKVTQGVHFAPDRPEKVALLKEYLEDEPSGLSLVFARTKHGAERLMKELVKAGFAAVSIHGNKSQGQRERALKAFRDGDARVLVATDVAARGIDIPGVSHVFNFDLPEVAENYVHRIGRTARAGADGDAISFVAGVDMGPLREIEKLMKISIPVLGGEEPEAEKRVQGQNRGGGGNRRGGRPQPKPSPKPAQPARSEGEAKSGRRRRRRRNKAA